MRDGWIRCSDHDHDVNFLLFLFELAECTAVPGITLLKRPSTSWRTGRRSESQPPILDAVNTGRPLLPATTTKLNWMKPAESGPRETLKELAGSRAMKRWVDIPKTPRQSADPGVGHEHRCH
jgi:hypothetical protein